MSARCATAMLHWNEFWVYFLHAANFTSRKMHAHRHTESHGTLEQNRTWARIPIAVEATEVAGEQEKHAEKSKNDKFRDDGRSSGRERQAAVATVVSFSMLFFGDNSNPTTPETAIALEMPTAIGIHKFYLFTIVFYSRIVWRMSAAHCVYSHRNTHTLNALHN